MRALTVRQPWATAMFEAPVGPIINVKDVENRSWRTEVPEAFRVAIHAALAVDRHAFPELEFDLRDRGVILGTVELTGVHEAGDPGCIAHKCDSNPWAFWPADPFPRGGKQTIYHWVLEHPRQFVTPIRARGALGLWRPDDSLRHLIETADIL